MNIFTIDELDILQVLIKNQLKTTENIGHRCVLEQLADKCTEAKIDAGYKYNLNDSITLQHDINDVIYGVTKIEREERIRISQVQNYLLYAKYFLRAKKPSST